MAYTTINKPNLHFNTVLYTGNGGTQSVTGVGFQPDLVWIKDRVATDYHWWTDAIRGATKTLHSNVATAETTQSTSLTAFGGSGFTLGSDASVNRNGDTFVSWNWLGANTTVSNTLGTITSTVSANTTAGFSVLSYTGNGTSSPTFGHGLGVAPKFVIIKNRQATESWQVWLNNNIRLQMNTTNTSLGTLPISTSSTLITLPTFDGAWNTSAVTYIAYCFAPIKGYSSFGSYTGNGSTDGTFVYTGFKPAYLMIKQSSASGEGWFILDNKRETINPMGTLLIANDAGADNTSQNPILDFTSNGFKLRRTWSGVNGSGSTYIYAAFAEQPLVGTNNIPATAR